MAHKQIFGSRMCMPNFYKCDFSEGTGGDHKRPLPNVMQLKSVPTVASVNAIENVKHVCEMKKVKTQTIVTRRITSTKVACKSSCIHSSFNLSKQHQSIGSKITFQCNLFIIVWSDIDIAFLNPMIKIICWTLKYLILETIVIECQKTHLKYFPISCHEDSTWSSKWKQPTKRSPTNRFIWN